jgi:predicted branched-subunit amino acid permease
MGIALYGMFIAIVLPVAKKSKPVVIIVAISVAVVCILRYVPLFHMISSGFRVIIATIIGAGIGAILFPITDDKIPDEKISPDHDTAPSHEKERGGSAK